MQKAAAARKVSHLNDVKVKLDQTSTAALWVQVQSQVIAQDQLLATAVAFWANCSAAVIEHFMNTFRNRDDLVMTSIFMGILHFEQFSRGVWAMSSESAWDTVVGELINRFFHDIKLK